MDKLKYIVTDNNSFAIFSVAQSHSDIARGMWGKPVGAGVCSIARKADSEHANVHCWGESVSLKLKSREEDEEIINRYLEPEY
jgi:hypothetical protein